MQQCKVQSSLIKFLGPFPMLLQSYGEFSIHGQYLPQHVFNFALSISVTPPYNSKLNTWKKRPSS